MKNLKKIYKLDNANHKNNYTFLEVIVITLIFGLIVCGLTTFIVYNIVEKTTFDSNLQDVVSTYKDIESKYYEDVDTKKLADSAINGMFDYLGEKYSELLDTNHASNLTTSLKDNYTGIGIQVYKNNGRFFVYSVIPNSVADSAGLQAKDELLVVNKKTLTSDLELSDISSLIHEKNEVYIKVLRDSKEIEYNLKVSNVTIPVITSKLIINDNTRIGYIAIDSFTNNVGNQFKNELELLEHRGIDSLIIDVRNNTGGYLSGVDDISKIFLKKGKRIYSLEGKDLNRESIDDTDEKRDYPIVVLINEYSASASEVLALALKESYGATLIGSKTYGKGKVQETSSLSGDTMIKYTAAKWYSPNGNNIDGIGITPGIKVSQNIEFVLKQEGSVDSQLEKAKSFLSN